ncbi:piggyBac transposable element-derived protein 4-like [Polypterus senegalus]|uniref:piggyBac transposable element-derived protein 4-like n=1 Tax=Polypterus senegalus TaxID=55291 RepID=UPI001965660F|nr:piggyBac transposable element-derived protein 4-like [Polypterus senegalus]
METSEREELFEVLETSTDLEKQPTADTNAFPLNLSTDVKWLEIPLKGKLVLREEGAVPDYERTFSSCAAASASSSRASDALCADSSFAFNSYEGELDDSSSTSGLSDTSANNSDIDFSDLEEDPPDLQTDDGDDDCSAPTFWGEPGQPISIEEFTSSCGPRLALPEEADARDYFRLLFPDSLFEHIVLQTNSYALYRQRKNGKSDPNWRATDIREMQAYIGLNILMGINQLPDYGMYWATDIFIGNAGFKKTMTARRFEKLNQNIQLCDREREPSRGQPSYDGLYKIRPLLDVVQRAMWDVYGPNRCLTIDEGEICVKGRFSVAQYMPSKPISKGLKVWMLCDSKSGYCHRANIYVGRSNDDLGGVGCHVVKSLIRGLEGKYHHIFLDSFFTSVPLVQKLLKLGLYMCGTTLQDRKGFPDTLKLKNIGKLAQGEFCQCQHGNILATVMRDTKVISCLSSNASPGIVGISQEKQRDGKVCRVPRPLPLLLYQENMCGVDLCNQLRECYPIGQPCKKWWRYFLWFYLNICIVNSFIILRENRKGSPLPGFTGKQFTQRHFRIRLAQQLIGDYQGTRGVERATRKRHSDSPVEYGHRLERMSERSRRCRNCTNKGLRHESVFGCKICNVHLCRGGCFAEFHK